MLSALLLALSAPQELFTAHSAADDLGYQVAAAGDVDGDGRDDFLASTQSSVGPVQMLVLSGRTGEVLRTIVPPGQVPGTRAYAPLAGAGDADADGHADALVGTPLEDVLGLLDVGSARVFSTLDGSLIHEVFGLAASDRFGAAVAGGRDVDGDGYDDFLVGAPGDPSGANLGYATLFSGRDAAVLFTFSGVAPGDRLGAAVTLLDDVDGDLLPDLAVGAPGDAYTGAGWVRLFSGVTGQPLRTLSGTGTVDNYGSALDSVGDMDGDGFGDLVIGLLGASRVQVVSGATGAVLHDKFEPWQMGMDVAGLGDADGDGTPDFAAAAGNSPRVQVWSGATGAPIGTLSGSAPYIDGDSRPVAGGLDVDGDGLGDLIFGVTDLYAPGSVRAFGFQPLPHAHYGDQGGYGNALVGLGDLDGDGHDDYAVGESSAFYVYPPVGIGRVEVLSGRDGTRIDERRGVLPYYGFGWLLAAVDDLDGDGASEVATCTQNNPKPERVVVYSPLTGQTFHDIQLGDVQIRALASGGDADGDGTSDLLVGLPLDASGVPSAGLVLVFSGASGTPLPGAVGTQPAGSFGSAVAWVGDLNGDGLDDWVAGAPGEAGSVPDLGRVHLHSGLDGALIRTFEGLQPGGGLGGSLAVLPDIDGDSLRDLLLVTSDTLPGQYQGSVYALSSASGALLRTIRGEFTTASGALSHLFRVGAVGDHDVDGVDDYAAWGWSPTDPGSVYVFSTVSGERIATRAGRVPGDGFGLALVGLDATGDGRDDLLVSAPWSAGPAGGAVGSTLVFDGGASALANYCGTTPSSAGCTARVSADGTASRSQPSGFELRVTGVEGGRSAFLFFGHEAQTRPWGASGSKLCVRPPLMRTGAQFSGGTSGLCDGRLTLDFNTWMSAHPLRAPTPGTAAYLQAWFVDGGSPTGSQLSDALSFSVVP